MANDEKCSNYRPCSCPNESCVNHGKCCACAAHHRDVYGGIPNCFKKEDSED